MTGRKALLSMLLNYDDTLTELAGYFNDGHYDLNNEECREADRKWKVTFGALNGVREFAFRLGIIDKNERFMFVQELIEKLEAE